MHYRSLLVVDGKIVAKKINWPSMVTKPTKQQQQTHQPKQHITNGKPATIECIEQDMFYNLFKKGCKGNKRNSYDKSQGKYFQQFRSILLKKSTIAPLCNDIAPESKGKDLGFLSPSAQQKSQLSLKQITSF
uniref:Uncharacterized protein n=1 Tax=Glossina pallidipes TaxID=7398 RepID=A0A1B0A8Y6_GLOPL